MSAAFALYVKQGYVITFLYDKQSQLFAHPVIVIKSTNHARKGFTQLNRSKLLFLLELDRVKKKFEKIFCISTALILLGFVAAEAQDSQQQALFLLRKARQAQELNQPEKARALIRQAQELQPGIQEPVWPTQQQLNRKFDDLTTAARKSLLNNFRKKPDPDTLWLLEVFLIRNPQDQEIRNTLVGFYLATGDQTSLKRLGHTIPKADYSRLSLKIISVLLISALALWQLWVLLKEIIQRPS